MESCLLFLSVGCGFRKALLVDFSDEGIGLALGLFELELCDLLLLVLGGLILKSVLVEDFVLSLTRVESVRVAMVVLKLLEHASLGILSSDGLVLHVDLIDLALLDQPLILIVTDLSLFACLELLPCLLFDHSGIRIEILPL